MCTNLDVTNRKYLRNNVKMHENLMNDPKKQVNQLNGKPALPVLEQGNAGFGRLNKIAYCFTNFTGLAFASIFITIVYTPAGN